MATAIKALPITLAVTGTMETTGVIMGITEIMEITVMAIMGIITVAAMTMINPAGLAFALLAAACPASAERCHVLKSARGETLYSSEIPPFDLSYPPYSRAYEASRSRGEHLIITADNGCFDEAAFVRLQRQLRALITGSSLMPDEVVPGGSD